MDSDCEQNSYYYWKIKLVIRGLFNIGIKVTIQL